MSSDLERHCAFFDPQNTGYIYPSKTYIRLKQIGFPFIIAFLCTIVLHVYYADWWSDFPDFSGKIKIAKLIKENADLDNSRIVTSPFERKDPKEKKDIPSQFSHIPKPKSGKLSMKDVVENTKSDHWFIRRFKWWMLWFLKADSDNLVDYSDLKNIHNDSLFLHCMDEHRIE